jgi:hypothetical protein
MYGIEAEEATRYRLSRWDLERRGRWRAFWRTAFVAACLLLVQVPLLAVATGVLAPADEARSALLRGEVPVRLALLADFALIAAYVTLAHRALEIARSVRPRPTRLRTVAAWTFWAVVIAGILDVVENVIVWLRAGGGAVEPDLLVGGVSEAKFALLLAATAGFLVVGAKVRTHIREMPRPAAAVPDDDTSEPDGRVICCSGGGIRAASFSLGALQVLTAKNVYQTADAVVGVSGGGYVAAAHHVLRWRSGPRPWPRLDPPAFSPDSPEHARLRRNTRYLFDSAPVAIHAGLSLLFGIAVNLVLVAAVLGATAWLLAWVLLASGGLSGWGTYSASGAAYGSEQAWSWVPWLAAAPLLLGVLLFVVEKVVDKYRTVGAGLRSPMRDVSVRSIAVGAALLLLLVVLPKAMEWLNDYAAANQSALADLIHVLGLGPAGDCSGDPDVVCVESIPGGGSTGAVTTGSAIALAAALLAVVRDVRSQFFGDKKVSAAGSPVGRLWGRVKGAVLPWIAAVVVVVVLTVLLLRWVAALVHDPDLMSSWHLALWFGVAVIAVALLTDANRTSLHHFYRERLSFAYLARRGKGGAPEPVEYSEPLRFSESRPPSDKGPGLVSCAVANVTDTFLVPTDRDCTPFVFEHSCIGLSDRMLPAAALSPSALYEFDADFRHRDATIPAAMAISGAAFSPLAGRENRRVGPYRLVLALANARLGAWLPNPLWVDEAQVVRRLVRLRQPDAAAAWCGLGEEDQRFVLHHVSDHDRAWLYDAVQAVPERERPPQWPGPPSWFERGEGDPGRDRASWHKARELLLSSVTKPGAFLVLREAFGRTSVMDRRLYVTDGGHYDNLGLIEALRRRPAEVVVLDASNDEEDAFTTLGKAIATARIDLGCEIDFDPRQMRRLEAKRASAAWGHGTIRYPGPPGEKRTGHLWVAKVIMLDDLPWDIETYAADHPEFPRTSTGDQLYGEFDLEAYRMLGREIARRMFADRSLP